MPRRKKIVEMPAETVVDTALSNAAAESDELFSRIDKLQKDSAGRIARDELWEKLYHMRRTIPVRADGTTEETYVSSRPMDVVNLAADILTTHEPSVDVPPLTDRADARKEAELLEKFLSAAFYTLQKRSVKSLIYEAAFNINLYGRLVMRVLPIDSAPDGLPIRWQVRHPKFCFPEFNADGGLMGIAECFSRKAGAVRASLPQAKLLDDSGDELDDDADVDWAEWWDGLRFVYFVNGKEVHRAEHHYGAIPYVFRYGRFAASEEESEQAIGMLRPIEWSQFAFDRMLSTAANVAVDNAFGAWAHTSDDGQAKEIYFENRAVNHFRTGEKIEPMQRQAPLTDLDHLTDRMERDMEGATFRAMLGAGDGSSGYAFTQMTRNERLKMNPVKQGLDFALSEVFALIVRFIGMGSRTVELAVPRVPGLTDQSYLGSDNMVRITPAMARKYKTVFVATPPDYLMDMQIATSLALQATARGLVDKDTARRVYMRLTDTETIRRNLAEEGLEAQAFPLWVQYLFARLGLTPPGAPGAADASGAMPPNGGMPVTTPDQPTTPDSLAGVPPAMQGEPAGANAQAINAQLGAGMGDMGMQQALMLARGTPQATGRGR